MLKLVSCTAIIYKPAEIVSQVVFQNYLEQPGFFLKGISDSNYNTSM